MNYITFTLLLISMVILSCDDFILKDISKEKVELITPSDKIKSDILTHNFVWNKIEGALQYNLQIATPDFDHPVKLILDTLIAHNKFEFTLPANTYQWRVRAENGEYFTPYTTNNLELTEPQDLKNQIVKLVSPVKAFQKEADVKFEWESLLLADIYTFELYKTKWKGELELTENIDATSDSKISINKSLEEGKYYWGIKAVDNDSKTETIFSNTYFYIDKTEPATPELKTPANNATKDSFTINFSWTITEFDVGSPISCYVKIYSDEALTNLVKEVNTKKETVDYTFTENGTYYWVVKAIDSAGNESSVSAKHKLIIDKP